MSIYQLLRARWLEAGIAVNEGITQAVLARFEENHHVCLPRAFKEYLLTVNGMKEGQTDENLVSFLSLETIDQEANCKQLSGNQMEIIIAEFCIYSHVYALRTSGCGEPLAIFATDRNNEKLIASSFEDFVNQYLHDPAMLAYCWP